MTLTDRFENSKIWRLLLHYSIPTIIASSVHALYNIVDRIYIGKALGTDALAGVTLTFPIFILSIALGVLVGNGSATVISIKLGEKDKKTAELALGNTIGLFIIIGLFVTFCSIFFLKPMLYTVGATAKTFPYAYKYLIWFLPFMVFDFLAMGTNGAIRSEGNPHLAMKIAITGAFLNIILDPIFLFVFKMGVQGIALATAISRITTASLVIYHFTLSKHRLLTLHLKNLIPQWQLTKRMLAIGVAPFSMNLATTFVTVFSNRALLANGGDIAIGALGAIQSVFIVIETPLRGLMMAGQPIIGYNYGAKLYGRVKETLKYAYLYSLVISCVGLSGVLIFGKSLISLFSKGDMELINIGSHGLTLFMVMIPFAGLHMMSAMYYQAVGKPKKAIFLNLLRKVFIFLPALFILPKFIGLDGVWLATPIADFTAAIVAILFIYNEIMKKR